MSHSFAIGRAPLVELDTQYIIEDIFDVEIMC